MSLPEYTKTSDIGILFEILEERNRQRAKFSFKHDRDHNGGEWIALITMYLGKAANGEFGLGPHEYDKRLVQVAALVMAALEHERARK